MELTSQGRSGLGQVTSGQGHVVTPITWMNETALWLRKSSFCIFFFSGHLKSCSLGSLGFFQTRIRLPRRRPMLVHCSIRYCQPRLISYA